MILPLTFVLLAASVHVSSANVQNANQTVKVNFTDCGPNNIKEIRVTPCPGDGTVCQLELGSDVSVEADFVAKHEAGSLLEIVKLQMRGNENYFRGHNRDPCQFISGGCPISIGQLYQYKAEFEVDPKYPAIDIGIRYELLNPAGEVVFCARVAAKLNELPAGKEPARRKPKRTRVEDGGIWSQIVTMFADLWKSLVDIFKKVISAISNAFK